MFTYYVITFSQILEPPPPFPLCNQASSSSPPNIGSTSCEPTLLLRKCIVKFRLHSFHSDIEEKINSF